MGRFTTKYKISDFAESGYAILLGSHQAAIVLQVVDDFKKRPRRLEDGPEVAVRRGLFLLRAIVACLSDDSCAH
jgi:hypothetical protein